jgi:DNA-binding transcriptional ArsR family regulator
MQTNTIVVRGPSVIRDSPHIHGFMKVIGPRRGSRVRAFAQAEIFPAVCNYWLDTLTIVSANLRLVDAYLQAGLEALGDATRLAIFQKLATGPMAVNELAGVFPVSRPAVSQHLRVLKDAGLVNDTKAGTRRVYRVNPEGIAVLRAHFDLLWEQALGAFKLSAEAETPGEKHGRDRRKGRRS